MKNLARKLFVVALLACDAAAICVSFYLAYRIRFYSYYFSTPKQIPSLDAYLGALFFVLWLWLILFYFLGMYRGKKEISLVDEFYSVLIAVSFATSLSMALTFFYREFSFSRIVVALSWGLNCVFITSLRVVVRGVQRSLYRSGVLSARALLVGSIGDSEKMMKDMLSKKELGYNVTGILDENFQGERFDGIPVFKKEDVPELLKKLQVEELVLFLSSSTQEKLLDLLLKCEDENVKLTVVPDLFGIITSRVRLESAGGLPLLSLEEIPLKGVNAALKRIMDFALSLLLFAILSPVLLVIALLVKFSRLSSRGPAFFVQERVGYGGQSFNMIKFRTMRVDAEKETGPVWATEDDPRRTKLGTFLRKTSLDELPQIFNVLKAEMSLVGPRPERPFFVDKFQKEVVRYMRRHKIKPGITGWAQIHGLRGDSDINERTKYDLYYVENWSLLLDVKILVRTAFEVLFHKSAY